MTRESFKDIFEMYFDEIRRYIYFRGGDAALADDVAQQTFLKIWEKQIQMIPGKEKGLLYKIASAEFIDQLRKNKYKADFSKDFKLTDDSDNPEEQMKYKELHSKFVRVLNKMRENQRTVFLMSRNEGLKYTEISERLNISVKAVEKRMSGALSVLTKELKPE